MNSGKTLFAQLLDFLPWSTFSRIVSRYRGDQRVRTLSCAEHYRAMAFAQLTYRRVCATSKPACRCRPRTLFLALPRSGAALDAGRCQRGARLAHLRGVRPAIDRPARRLYVNEALCFDLANTVYALDFFNHRSLSAVFPSAHFRTTKSAVKMHTLLDFRGNIPSFIHVSYGKLHDVHALDLLLPEAGAFYVMDRGYLDFARLHLFHLAGAFFVTRAKSNFDAPRVYSAPINRRPVSSSIRPSAWMVTTLASITPNPCAASAFATPKRANRWCSSPTTSACLLRPSAHCIKAAGKSNCSSNGSSSICASNASLAHPQMRCTLKSGSPSPFTSSSPSSKSVSPSCLPLHIATDFLCNPLRENAFTSSSCSKLSQRLYFANI